MAVILKLPYRKDLENKLLVFHRRGEITSTSNACGCKVCFEKTMQSIHTRLENINTLMKGPEKCDE